MVGGAAAAAVAAAEGRTGYSEVSSVEHAEPYICNEEQPSPKVETFNAQKLYEAYAHTHTHTFVISTATLSGGHY